MTPIGRQFQRHAAGHTVDLLIEAARDYAERFGRQPDIASFGLGMKSSMLKIWGRKEKASLARPE